MADRQDRSAAAHLDVATGEHARDGRAGNPVADTTPLNEFDPDVTPADYREAPDMFTDGPLNPRGGE